MNSLNKQEQYEKDIEEQVETDENEEQAQDNTAQQKETIHKPRKSFMEKFVDKLKDFLDNAE
jgi:formylmethanofuran dehydrogenase subunit E